MNDEQIPASEAGDEVVQSEAEQAEASEATESTEGQVEGQTAGEESEADQPEDDAPDDDANVSKSKARRERQKAHIRELEGRAQTLERLRQAASSDSPAPVESDFDDYDDFRIAKALYQQQQAGRQTRVEELTAEQKQIQQIQRAQKQALWNEQVQEAVGRHEDFEKVAMNPQLAITPVMGEIIQDSDMGADVLYHLGSNPAEAARIARLPPLRAAIELGKIEARVSAPKPKTATKAPDPIKPVAARATGQKDPAKMSHAEFVAWRESGGTF